MSRCAYRRPLSVALRRVLSLACVAVGICAVAPTAAGNANSTTPDYQSIIRTSQAAIGRPLADIPLRDSNGKAVRFSDYQGRPLLISLVYTGCFQACPVATQFLAEAVQVARKALGEDKFRVVSVGFNQPFDTPEAMAAFKRQNRINLPGWDFLSPDVAQVDALTTNLGFVYEATPKGFDHVTQVTIVDADGVIYRQVYGENFDLPMLVQPLKELLSGQASREMTLENVWEKVILYCTVYDPFTGGYRVNYSLFFEIFAGLTTLGAIAWVVIREWRRSART
jgi:protein SCO1/2